MNFKPLLFKKDFLFIAALEILLILIIPVKSFTQEINSKFFRLDKQMTMLQNSKQFSDDALITLPALGVDFIFRLGFGHHDNLTKAKSWTGPKVKSNNTYWTLYIQAGVPYKKASASVFWSYVAPIPRTKIISGFGHKVEQLNFGLLLSMRLLSMKSRVNFTPVVGHRVLDEIADIFDPQGMKPDSLTLSYADNGMLFGLDFENTLYRIGELDEFRMVFGYRHEYLRREVNRYRVELRLLGFSYEGEIIDYNQFVFLSVVFEHARSSDGRRDWFVSVSFGGVLK